MKKRGGSKKTKKSGRRRLKNPPKAKRKSRLRFWLKAHGGATAFFLVSYLVLGLMISPDFLKEDLKNKYGKVLGAVNVSVLVIGMPVKPVVSATSGCDGSYPYVNLDWADDLGVDTFDVRRDGAILVAGLTSSQYRDNSVSTATTYSYSVAAHGPAGENQSDVKNIETEQCGAPPPPPPATNITITGIDNINDLANFFCVPETKSRPTFSGTTNVARGRISTEIAMRMKGAKRRVLSAFWANGNGYWQWRSTGKLKKGYSTIQLTVADPNDNSRTATTSLSFKVGNKKMSQKAVRRCRVKTFKKQAFSFPTREIFSGLDMQIQKSSKIAHPGEALKFSLSGEESDYLKPASLRELKVIDEKGGTIYAQSLNQPESERGEWKIDEKTPPGNYTLMARFATSDLDVSALDDFQVKEKPLLVLGSGLEVTSRQLISNLGWAAFFSLGLLGMFLFLLFFEYHLSKRALVQITGSFLKKKGMID